jgi:ribosomal protein S12 methylthiotransferase accessory factor
VHSNPATITVFLGPSLPLEEARRRLPEASFKAPVQRGDLEGFGSGDVVGIIDGVFHQNLSVSPSEIRQAAQRGARILGSSSMGALRATEVPEMEGVGRVYEMFREGIIEDDDEVALTFHPETHRPLSEPMVNVRYGVDRLVRAGTLNPVVGERILKAGKRLHYRDRTHRRILEAAGLTNPEELAVLGDMFRMHDLKREDAISLLEKLSRIEPGERAPAADSATFTPEAADPTHDPSPLGADAPIFLWEYGERLSWDELLEFMKVTGVFPEVVRRALARHTLAGNPVDISLEGGPDPEAAAAELIGLVRRQWSWVSAEEARITQRDLGFRPEDVQEAIEQEIAAGLTLMALSRAHPEELSRVLRAELMLNELALKREAIRLGSLQFFAHAAQERADVCGAKELAAAREVIAQTTDARDWPTAVARLGWWGVSRGRAEAVALELALARKGAADVWARVKGERRVKRRYRPGSRADTLRLRRRPKHRGDARFSLSPARAAATASKLRGVVGITRVGMITGLDVVGIPNACAFRPGGEWSSTIGSGKSLSAAGARAGAIMEEVEKWAQERFPASEAPRLRASYRALHQSGRRVLDPSLLDLPHGTSYQPDLLLEWHDCDDLIGGGRMLVPAAAVEMSRLENDIFYSPRLGRKAFTTNGLASAFSLEEALCHAICEVVERHALVTSEIVLGNPGAAWAEGAGYRFVDLSTMPASTRRLIQKLQRAGTVRLLDVTSEVRIPTFHAAVVIDDTSNLGTYAAGRYLADGSAAYPDAEVAANMAFLEASQSMVMPIAGAREDLTLFSRSLGRHERTRATTRAGWRLFRRPETETKPMSAVRGLRSRDVLEDVTWSLDRLCEAGVEHVLAIDYSLPQIRPARVVRVLIPGLETLATTRTGPRARARMISDLL